MSTSGSDWPKGRCPPSPGPLCFLKALTKVMISCLHFGDEGERFAEKRRLMEMQQEGQGGKVTEQPQRARASIESASGGPEPRSLGESCVLL